MTHRNAYKAIAGTAIMLFLYLPEILAWHSFPLLCFKIFILVICILPTIKHAQKKERYLFLALNIILLIASIPYLFAITYFSATLFLLNYCFLALTIAVFVALYLCSPDIAVLKKLLLCYAISFTLSTSIMVSAMCIVGFLPIASPQNTKGNMDLIRPALRYSFAVNRDGDKLLSCPPLVRKCEIISLSFPFKIGIEILPEDLSIMNFSYGPGGKTVVGVEWYKGAIIFDRNDFKIISKNYFDSFGYDKPPIAKYRSVAYYQKDNEVLVGKADGTLIHLSYPDLKIKKKEMLVRGVYSLFNKLNKGDEIVNAFYISEPRNKLIFITSYGFVHTFDLKSHRIIASRFLFSPLHNAVLSHDGKTFYVASIFTGLVFRMKIDDLAIEDVKYIKPGVRYMTILEDREILIISNYFNGLVTLYDPSKRVVIASVATTPRIEWLEVLPEAISLKIKREIFYMSKAGANENLSKARYLCVQHGGGISWIDINHVMAMRLIEKPSYSYPLYVLKYQMNKGLNPLNYPNEIFKINIATLLTSLCQICCCGLFVYMVTRSKRCASTRYDQPPYELKLNQPNERGK